MDNENFILEGSLLEVASYKNYKEAIFLISVLDQPDLYGRIIPYEAGEKYHKTIIGYPVVAKLKRNIFGQVSDFDGHAIIEVKAPNDKKKKKFTTQAIGSILEAWIEEREVEGYDGKQQCILCKAKLWVSRFPEYFKVFDKLWEQGKVQSSWELTASKIESSGENKIYKIFEFIGTCCLGSLKTPAVPGAGVLEYAEMESDYDAELSDALEKDLIDLDMDNNKKEEGNLADKKNKEASVSVAENQSPVVESANHTEENTAVAEATVNTDAGNEDMTNETVTASLTDRDLYRQINKACEKAVGYWGYISYWFPEEKTVWFKCENAETQLDYKLFTYEVVDDVVTVSESQDVKLTVSVVDVNTVIAEKDEKIGALTAELEIKDDAVIKAGEKINKLNVEISELKPYKDAVEKAEKERIDAEIAEAKEKLKNNMLKTKLFTDKEIASAEIAELIESRNETAIKNLIAERYIASFDNDNKESELESASYNPESNTSVANLEVDDIDESPSSFMKKLLSTK